MQIHTVLNQYEIIHREGIGIPIELGPIVAHMAIDIPNSQLHSVKEVAHFALEAAAYTYLGGFHHARYEAFVAKGRQLHQDGVTFEIHGLKQTIGFPSSFRNIINPS